MRICNRFILLVCCLFLMAGTFVSAKTKIFVYPNHKLKGYSIRTLDDLLDLKDNEIDYSVAALILSREFDPSVNIDFYLKKIDKLVAPLIKKFKEEKISDPWEKIWMLNKYLYRTCGYKYVLRADHRLFLLSEVLKRKKGHCFGLTTLYLAIGQRIGLNFTIISAHRHVYVQYNGKQVIRMETGDYGNHFELDWLKRPRDEFAYKSGQYFKPFSGRKFVAMYCKDLASYLAQKSRSASTKKEEISCLDNANKFVDISLRLFPNLYTALFMKGIIYYNLGWKDSALYYFNKAFKENEADETLAVYLARIYYERNQFDKCLAVLERSYVYNKRSPGLCFNMSLCCIKLKKYDKCIKYSNATIKLARRYARAYMMLSEAYLGKRDYVNAKWTARRLIDLAPVIAAGYVVLAESYLGEGNPEKAQKILDSMRTNVVMRMSFNAGYVGRIARLTKEVKKALAKKYPKKAKPKAKFKKGLKKTKLDKLKKIDKENKKKKVQTRKAFPKPKVIPYIKPLPSPKHKAKKIDKKPVKKVKKKQLPKKSSKRGSSSKGKDTKLQK